MNDLKFAIRRLRRAPAFAAVVVLTLALGIGANTAVFSIVHGVLLKPLPYPDSARLVTLWERAPERGIEQERVSGPDYLDWRAKNSVFSDMGVSPGWDDTDFNIVFRDSTVNVRGCHASSSLFTTLGGAPLLGRTFSPDEDRKEGNAVAVLGYGLWQRHFGGNPNVLGRKLTVDKYGRRDYTIIGVMRPGFGLPGACELWLPLGWMGVTLDERRSAHWHNVIARLKPGVTPDQAEAQMSSIQSLLKQAHPTDIIGSEVSVVPLVDQAVGRNFRTALLVLWGAVAGVLMIACANVANLTLVRLASRQKELAVCFALGARPWRVRRQFLVESILLAIAGGGLGAVLAQWGTRLFISLSPGNIPRLGEVSVDGAALAFTFGSALLSGILFGLAPAWRGSRVELNEAMKETGRGLSTAVSARWTRQVLVVAETAIAIVLLIGTGLMLRSFATLLATDRGFRAERVLTADLDFSVSGFTTWVEATRTRPQVALRELLERVRHLPAVESAGASYRFLRPDNRPPAQTFVIFGRPIPPSSQRPSTEVNAVTPGYLHALGIPFLRGRDFADTDSLEAPGVALVSESFARRFFPNEDPLGQHITMAEAPGPLGSKDQYGVATWCEIVGIVGDVKSLGMPPESEPEVYRSYWQYPMQTPTLAVRVSGPALALAAAIRREVKAVAPNLPTPRIQPMAERVSESVAEPRFEAGLLSLFGLLALFLAACGIYGVVAFSVAQRRQEIGVRVALGAKENDILRLVLRQGLGLALAGVTIGLAMAAILSKLLHRLLYEVTPTDTITFVAVALGVLVVASLACWLPARRAAGIEPMDALRHE